jgi:hypothetical protein
MASAGQLLAAPSSLTRDTAAQLLGVECQRALRLLNVVQILGGDYVLWRTALAPADLLGRLRESLEHEFRVGGLQRSLRIDVEPGLVVHGSEELLLTGIGSAVAALNGVAVAAGPRQFELAAARGANGTVVLVVRERGLCIPQRWAERAFDEPWPVPDSAAAFAMLQAVREVATAHGGSATVRSGDDATEVCLTLAAGR